MQLKRVLSYVIGLSVILVFSQCSTKNNTWLSRNFQSFSTRYNVYFNANESYKKGIEKIATGHKDSYTEILPIFPISVHSNATFATNDMAISIEKSEEAIKNHSIQRKPKRNPAKLQDPSYQAFLNQSEYNPMVEQSWLLIGKSQFHQADFMAANATFLYVIRNYTHNQDLVTAATIWLARSYGEVGWFYEADDLMNKLNETRFNPATNLLFMYVKADLLLKQKRHREALPFLQTAYNTEKNQRQRARLAFILGQIYEKEQQYDLAYTYFNETLRKNPPYEMAFNANLKKAQSYQGKEYEKIIKDLNKLAKNERNYEFLDQIYTAIAKLYQRNGNTPKAIEHFELAIEKSTRNGIDKAEALLALGQIYLDNKQYVKAQPLINEAVPILPANYTNYRQLRVLSENLNELALHQNRVTREDSLQILAQLPEAERLARIQEVINAEKIAQEKLQQKINQEAKKQEDRERSSFSTLPSLALGEIGDKSWYFYNPTLMGRGKIEFQRTWGNRALEDNWRRRNKTVQLSDKQEITETDVETSNELSTTETTIPVDSIAPSIDNQMVLYLQQIPLSVAQKEISNKAIMESLYNLVYIYKEKVPDYELAQQTYAELLKRFPSSPFIAEATFYMYQLHSQQQNNTEATKSKKYLIANFPTSTYAVFLQNPEGLQTLIEIKQAEEKLYKETYEAFLKNDYKKVISNVSIAQKEYPFSKLISKFAFLEALSTSQKDGKEAFRKKLELLVRDFPDSEITPMAKDMIALMQQGQEPQSSVSHGTLLAERVSVVTEKLFAENITKAGFTYEPNDSHLFVLVVETDVLTRNALVFDIASYNFTRFLIKELDIQVKEIDEKTTAIAISGLDNLSEAVWYQKSLLADSAISKQIQKINYKGFVISAYNYSSVTNTESLERYFEFYRSNNLLITEPTVIKQLEQQSGFVGGNPE
jgi:tetratricopeptide (TPR) repeat protein